MCERFKQTLMYAFFEDVLGPPMCQECLNGAMRPIGFRWCVYINIYVWYPLVLPQCASQET